MAQCYLVHSLGMQSQPRLQEEAFGMVINFLARPRGSYVTWPCLHAATRYQHQQQMSISLDAAMYVNVHTVLLLHDAPSLHSLTLSGANWTFTRLIYLMGGPGRGEGGGNTGCQYYLRGAGYTMVRTIQLLFYWKHDFVRGIGVVCVGYVHMRGICGKRR